MIWTNDKPPISDSETYQTVHDHTLNIIGTPYVDPADFGLTRADETTNS